MASGSGGGRGISRSTFKTATTRAISRRLRQQSRQVRAARAWLF